MHIQKEQQDEIEAVLLSADLFPEMDFSCFEREGIIEYRYNSNLYYFRFTRRSHDLYTIIVDSPSRTTIFSRAVLWAQLLDEIKNWISNLGQLKDNN